MEAAAPLGSLTQGGLRVPREALVARNGAPALRRLLRGLTHTARPLPGAPRGPKETRQAFRQAREAGVAYLYFPRALAPTLAPDLGGVVLAPELAAAWGAIRPLGPEKARAAQAPFPYQAAAAEHLRGLARPEGGWLAYLQMGTGLGKTRVGLAAAVEAGGPTFVVVPTRALREQWLSEARQAYPGLALAAYQNPRTAATEPAGPATADLVVGVANTVLRKKTGFFSGYALVVLDEAHELSARCSQNILWLAQGAPRVLGLSATPDERPDGLDRLVFRFLGPPTSAEADIPRFSVADVRFHGRVREVEYVGEGEYVEAVVSRAGTLSATATVGNLVRDPARLALVVAEVERLYFQGETDPAALGPGPPGRSHGVMVFAEHRDYLLVLRDAIMARFAPPDLAAPELGDGPAAEEDPGDSSGAEQAAAGGAVVLRGGVGAEALVQARAARVVLTTYGYSRRGISLANMTALVLATPRRRGLTQILGRILRRGSDETIRRAVVDIRDMASPLKSQSSDRRAAYREKGWPIFRDRARAADYAGDGRPPPPPRKAPSGRRHLPARRHLPRPKPPQSRPPSMREPPATVSAAPETA